MSEHVILSVDRLIAAADPEVGLHGPFGERTSAHSNAANEKRQCRICHEEDDIDNLEAPCACNGTMKLAHRACIARWIAEKLDNICEICRQPYEGHGVITPPPGFAMEAGAMSAADIAANQILDGGYDECATAEGARTAFLRASILIPIVFMMLKHAYDIADTEDQSFFNLINLFCLHLVTVLAPMYGLSWFLHLWLRRTERLERAWLREQVSRVMAQDFSAAAALPPGSNEYPQERARLREQVSLGTAQGFSAAAALPPGFDEFAQEIAWLREHVSRGTAQGFSAAAPLPPGSDEYPRGM